MWRVASPLSPSSISACTWHSLSSPDRLWRREGCTNTANTCGRTVTSALSNDAPLSLCFPYNYWNGQRIISASPKETNPKFYLNCWLHPAGSGKEYASVHKPNKDFITFRSVIKPTCHVTSDVFVGFPYFCTMNVRAIVSFWSTPTSCPDWVWSASHLQWDTQSPVLTPC